MDQSSEIVKPASIVELLKWKSCKNNTEIAKNKWPISVEEYNRNSIKRLGWDGTDELTETDTLYSIMSIYAIGIWVFNQEKCLEVNQLMKKIYIKIPRGDKTKKGKGKYSSSRVLCSVNLLTELIKQEGEFKEFGIDLKPLNKIVKRFVDVYFDLGNTIPMWPSGNLAKGNQNNGYMDIPELYFYRHEHWFNILKREYPQAHVEKLDVDNKKFESLFAFLESVKTPQKFESFIDYIVDVINYRTKLLNIELDKIDS